MLGRYRENRPGISYQNRSSAGCIMCANGQLDNTDGVFAPYNPAGSLTRNPHNSKHAPYTDDEGALIYVKVGHLA